MRPDYVMKTVQNVAEIGIPVALMTISTEALLNRTSLSEGKKALWAGLALGGTTVLAAGKAPRLAASAGITAIVYVAQAAARKTQLNKRVDQLLSQKRSEQQLQQQAQQQQQQQAQQQQQQTPTTPTTAGLPAPNGGWQRVENWRYTNAR